MEQAKQNTVSGSNNSNLIIITPDELLKLGLFQNLEGSVAKPSTSVVADSSVISLKQKLQNKIKAAAAEEKQSTTKSEPSENEEQVDLPSDSSKTGTDKVDSPISEQSNNLKIRKNLNNRGLHELEGGLVQKFVNIISNTPVRFSNEQVKHLISKSKSTLQTSSKSDQGSLTEDLNGTENSSFEISSSTGGTPSEQESVCEFKANSRHCSKTEPTEVQSKHKDSSTFFEKRERLVKNEEPNNCSYKVSEINNEGNLDEAEVVFLDDRLKHVMSASNVTESKSSVDEKQEELDLTHSSDINEANCSFQSYEVENTPDDNDENADGNECKINETSKAVVQKNDSQIEVLLPKKRGRKRKIPGDSSISLETDVNETGRSKESESNGNNISLVCVEKLKADRLGDGIIKNEKDDNGLYNIKGRENENLTEHCSMSKSNLVHTKTHTETDTAEKITKKRGRPRKNVKQTVAAVGKEDSSKERNCITEDTLKLEGKEHNNFDDEFRVKTIKLKQDEDNQSLRIKSDEDEVNLHKNDMQSKLLFSSNNENLTENNGLVSTLYEDLNVNLQETPKDKLMDKTSPVTVPKKRGRQRKNANVNGTEENTESTVPSEEKFATSTPVARKRGRKRKTVSPDDSAADAPEEIILEESASGRKRKKVNYFNMENSVQVEEEYKKRRHKTLVSSATLSSIKNEQEDVTCSLVNQQGPEDASSKDECPNTSLKRRKHGETNRMLNSIFNAALKNKSKAEEAEDNDSKGPSDMAPASTPIDRRTKGGKAAIIATDDNNMVMCMTCNKKVNNEEWAEHNQSVHYNLSWREGEQELNMDDTAFLTKTLKPILQKEKSLVCSKCNKKHTGVMEYIKHREECSGVVSSSGLVTCAVCKTEMEKSKWSFHKQRQHNNLAWRVGDHPLNLNDQKVVLYALNALYKAKKPLYCEKCGISKKSVVGFLSHQTQCGVELTEVKVKCEFCERRVLPVSMQTHIKLVHEEPKKKDIVERRPDYFDVNVDGLSSKRNAAKTAMLIIDKFSKNKVVQLRNKHYVAQMDFGEEDFVRLILQKELAEHQMIKCKFKNCDFSSDYVKILLEHMESCDRKPDQYYTCKKCLLVCDTEEQVKEHIKTAYNIDITEDEFKVDQEESDECDEDDDRETCREGSKNQTNFEKKRLDTDGNSRIKPSFLFQFAKIPQRLFSHAYQFTMEFCHRHFGQSLLFGQLRCKKNCLVPLEEDLVEKYLPKSEESCLVARRIVKGFESVLLNDYSFKQFELFESVCDEGFVSIFCGGPIYAIAWLPTPFSTLSSKQVLAVAAGSCFDGKFRVNENYTEPSVIQFWDFGILRNKQEIRAPQLLFCLGVDFGPVWHLEWCPSGCYDSEDMNGTEENASRMGLLAVAGSTPIVNVYSIPFLEEDEVGLVYRMNPVMRLQLLVDDEETSKKEKFYPTKISWSTGPGHKNVAVGYTNGIVATYDICTSSKLMRYEENGVVVLLPYKVFQAHTFYISALSWVPLSGGNRWLMTASFDRNALHDVHGCLRQFRNYFYERVYLTSCPSTIMSVSSSSWLNGIIQCNSVGEVAAAFPHQLMFGLESDKKLNSARQYFGFTKLVNMSKTPTEREEEDKIAKEMCKNKQKRKHVTSASYYNRYEPVTYKEVINKYGLLFCDMKMDKYSDLPKNVKTDELDVSKAHIYSLQTINKIAFNPNRQANLYYATGYQAGFVRVVYLKFLEDDPQIV
ncbi:hypothetical protein NQ318_007414 [Aromia moschata]|uniref:C2H2-type domain-containing protein n=1 Tax=Aromia moschata TaxID=1265417 RepID=A0AAV8YKA2_9CUCU|nr:hypothetical protein NQ318_007414 [Aromia moschata]